MRNYGGIFISDEVQTGWGRTGGKWFGIEQWGVTPDIITSAKGLGNGSPIGLTVAQPEVADSVKGVTISTFGGNPVTTTAGQSRDRFHRRAEPAAQLRRDRRATCAASSRSCKEKHEIIGDVRGMGLMQAIELVEDRKTKTPATAQTARLLEAARENGLLIGKGGLYGNVIRITPPMNIGRTRRGQVHRAAGQEPGGRAAPLAAGSAQVIAARNLRTFPGPASRVRFAVGAGGGQPLPVLLRRAVHRGLPHAHRRAALHQEDRDRQPARLRADHSRRQHPGPELLARLSGGCAVRRRLRDAPLQQAADRDRPAAALRDGAVLRAAVRRSRSAALGNGSESPASAADRRRSPAPPNCAGTASRVTVFDNRPLPGGLNTYGVAEYKLRPADSLREVDMVRSMGVEFRQARSRHGRRRSTDLEREFDFIFIGVGLGAMERLGIPGEDLPGVIDALRFIERYKTLPDFRVGRTRDRHRRRQHRHRRGQRRACGWAPKTSTSFYRRSETEMPAFPFEYDHSKVEGVQLPLAGAARRDRRTRTAARPPSSSCETRLGEPDASGRRIAGADSRHANSQMACDMVIPALGQSRLTADAAASR